MDFLSASALPSQQAVNLSFSLQRDGPIEMWDSVWVPGGPPLQELSGTPATAVDTGLQQLPPALLWPLGLQQL